jgi:hypothetical protein
MTEPPFSAPTRSYPANSQEGLGGIWVVWVFPVSVLDSLGRAGASGR